MKVKVGAESRNAMILAGVLLVAAVYLVWTNLIQGGDLGIPKSARKSAANAPSLPQIPELGQPPAARKTTARSRRPVHSQEWIPRVGGRRPEEGTLDPATVDPALRRDLLSRLQTVAITGGERSLFDFSAAPLPNVKEPLILPGKKSGVGGKGIDPAPDIAGGGPDSIKPVEAAAAPRIPLKFFGFVSARDGKRAFFLNGEEILVAGEGQTVQSRYKIVRIGVNSAVVEDTEHKRQQQIPLEEQPNT